MKYKFIAELINENMEIIQEVEVKVEEDSKLSAHIKAEKKVKKQHGTPENNIWRLKSPDKKNQLLLPMQRMIKYLQTQIQLTRSEKQNASKKHTQFAEHRRVSLKLCLLEANRELKAEKELIDSFHAQREKDWIAFTPKEPKEKKVSKTELENFKKKVESNGSPV